MTLSDRLAVARQALLNMPRWRPDATYPEWTERRDQLLAMLDRLDRELADRDESLLDHDWPTGFTPAEIEQAKCLLGNLTIPEIPGIL